jgi:hypothetical protein
VKSEKKDIFLSFPRIWLRGFRCVTLASSEEEQLEGGPSPPPRKKARKTVSLASEMHRRRTHLGDVDVDDCDTSSNGELLSASKHKIPSNQAKQKTFTKFEEDSVRLIGQHLRGLGLK